MVAHTQYTFWDNTLQAMELLLSAAQEDEVVLVVSDATYGATK
jgi:arabinogalactan endo-1,4-beta-galactosidase